MDKETKEYLQNNIIRDIEQMADDVSIVFDEATETGLPPITIIANLIVFAKKNDVDFWKTVKSNRSKYEYERLNYIFETNGLEGFENVNAEEKAMNLASSKNHISNNVGKYKSASGLIRKGKEVVGLEEAKLLDKNIVCEHYYIGKDENNGFLLATQSQKDFTTNKHPDRYKVYPAPYKEDVKL